jgi:hypothetical protein
MAAFYFLMALVNLFNWTIEKRSANLSGVTPLHRALDS